MKFAGGVMQGWIFRITGNNKAKLLEFFRFGIVGTISAGIHYAIYYCLQKYMGANVAYSAGYGISMISNFFMTSYLTFRTNPSFKKALGFGFSHLMNYLLQISLFNVCLLGGISKVMAPFLVLAVAVPVNFFLLRFIFRRLSASKC